MGICIYDHLLMNLNNCLSMCCIMLYGIVLIKFVNVYTQQCKKHIVRAKNINYSGLHQAIPVLVEEFSLEDKRGTSSRSGTRSVVKLFYRCNGSYWWCYEVNSSSAAPSYSAIHGGYKIKHHCRVPKFITYVHWYSILLYFNDLQYSTRAPIMIICLRCEHFS